MRWTSASDRTKQSTHTYRHVPRPPIRGNLERGRKVVRPRKANANVVLERRTLVFTLCFVTVTRKRLSEGEIGLLDNGRACSWEKRAMNESEWEQGYTGAVRSQCAGLEMS